MIISQIENGGNDELVPSGSPYTTKKLKDMAPEERKESLHGFVETVMGLRFNKTDIKDVQVGEKEKFLHEISNPTMIEKQPRNERETTYLVFTNVFGSDNDNANEKVLHRFPEDYVSLLRKLSPAFDELLVFTNDNKKYPCVLKKDEYETAMKKLQDELQNTDTGNYRAIVDEYNNGKTENQSSIEFVDAMKALENTFISFFTAYRKGKSINLS